MSTDRGKSGLLGSAVSRFLDDLGTERDFDPTLLALLRLKGFREIAFLHGPFEFGKDFIAQGCHDGQQFQFAFQSKLGNVGRADWDRDIQPQCEKMAYTDIAHPKFDKSLGRRNVLLLTGRLNAQARPLAQEYASDLARRGYPPLEVWDRETLTEELSADTCLGLTFDWPSFGHLIHESAEEPTTPTLVEAYSQRWLPSLDESGLWRAVLEFGLVRDELDRRELGFHAFRLMLGLLRAANLLAVRSGEARRDVATLIELIRQEIGRRGSDIVRWYNESSREDSDRPLRSLALGRLGGLVSLSTRALLLMEIVALDVLAGGHKDLTAQGHFFRSLLQVPAVARPISDGFAVSIPAIAVAAVASGAKVDNWLIQISEWIAEAYDGDDPVGLEPAGGSAARELWRTIGAIVDNPSIPSRKQTMIGAAILDTCSILELPQTYRRCHRSLVKNDVLTPERYLPGEGDAQFLLDRDGVVLVTGGDYPHEWQGKDGWKNGRAHEQVRPCWFDEQKDYWIGVGMSLLLRDRWWLHSLRSAAMPSLARGQA